MKSKLVYLCFATLILFEQKSFAECVREFHKGVDKSSIHYIASKFGVAPGAKVSFKGENCSAEVSYLNNTLSIHVERTEGQGNLRDSESFAPAPFILNSQSIMVVVKSSELEYCDYGKFKLRTSESDHLPFLIQKVQSVYAEYDIKTGKVKNISIGNVSSELIAGTKIGSNDSSCYSIQ